MNTVRFRLDNEQLPFTTAAPIESNYKKLRARIEEKSKRAGSVESYVGAAQSFCRRNGNTGSPQFAEASELPGPGRVVLLQPLGSSPAHSVSPIHQYTSHSVATSLSPKMDSSILQYSPTRVHPTPDYKSLHQELYNRRMERSFVDAADRQRPDSAQHGVLGRPETHQPLLPHPTDTDLCLSMVNETRPSYQMKVAGKQPLTQPHLTALLDNSTSSYTAPRSFTASAPANATSYSSAYKLNQKLSNSSPPPPPPPPPPALPSNLKKIDSSPKNLGQSPKRANFACNVSYSSNNSPTTYGNKTVRTFDDFDPDDILKDLRSLSTTRKSPSPSRCSPASSRTGSSNIPISVIGHHSWSPRNQFVSPKAKGYAPVPTDQPVTNPAKYGAEANVDAMTIRMMRNMDTGYGALGLNNCVQCGEGIFNDRPGCVALSKTYHIDCFVCHTCKVRLSGAPFYAVEDKHYCERDYIDTLDKCATCQKPIKDRVLRAGGRSYHPQCFTCVSCYKELDGIPFTVDANNSNYCMQCFHEKFAPRCASCHKPIIPKEGQKETTRVVAMDRSYHVECYKCEDCGLKLSSAIEGHGCYPLDNRLLCKNCNLTRLKRLTAP